MKNAVTLVSFCLFSVFSILTNDLFAQKDFTKLQNSTDSSYGYTEENPLKLKKGSLEKSISYSSNFLSGLVTQDNQALVFLSRSTKRNPNYKKPAVTINNRFTGMPVNGKGGILDKYIFVTSNTKDTLILFVDVYKKGILTIPLGLKFK